MSKKHKTQGNIIAQNRKARRDYELLEFVEAGIALQGSEVKSLRDSKVSFKDGYVTFIDDEAYLRGIHIAPYENMGPVGHGGHDPERDRKLLLHRREITMLKARVEQKGLTLVPVKMYFKNGRVKVEIALGRGRKYHDHRNVLKDKAMQRDLERHLAGH